MTKTMTSLERGIALIAMLFAASFVAVLLLIAAPAHAALLTQQLDQGMTNSDVTSLQTFLAADSTIYPEGIVSGFFGPLTAAAVSRYQTAHGLAAVGRVGPQTLAAINAQMGGSTPVNPSGDISAPIMSAETLTTGTNSATISWTTSESANHRAMYGTTWPFLYATAPSVSGNSFGTSANITIAGLQSHATYYYVRESIDASGNVMWTVGKPLTTQ